MRAQARGPVSRGPAPQGRQGPDPTSRGHQGPVPPHRATRGLSCPPKATRGPSLPPGPPGAHPSPQSHQGPNPTPQGHQGPNPTSQGHQGPIPTPGRLGAQSHPPRAVRGPIPSPWGHQGPHPAPWGRRVAWGKSHPHLGLSVLTLECGCTGCCPAGPPLSSPVPAPQGGPGQGAWMGAPRPIAVSHEQCARAGGRGDTAGQWQIGGRILSLATGSFSGPCLCGRHQGNPERRNSPGARGPGHVGYEPGADASDRRASGMADAHPSVHGDAQRGQGPGPGPPSPWDTGGVGTESPKCKH